MTPRTGFATTFRCTRCKGTYRKRVDNVEVRSDKHLCRCCSMSPDSMAEQLITRRTRATMSLLQTQGFVRSYNVVRNKKLSVAELSSVDEISKHPLYWDITVVAKLGKADKIDGMQTQLVHIELDGWQHFRFSSLWHKGMQKMHLRSIAQDHIKDSIIQKSTSSSYGARFKRVSMLRVALVRPTWKDHERGCRSKRQRGRHIKGVIQEASDEANRFLMQEFTAPQEGQNLRVYPAETYAQA